MKTTINGVTYYPVGLVEYTQHKLDNAVTRLENKLWELETGAGTLDECANTELELDELRGAVDQLEIGVYKGRDYYIAPYGAYKTCKEHIVAYDLRH